MYAILLLQFISFKSGMGASNASLCVRASAGPPQELEFGPVGPINSSITNM